MSTTNIIDSQDCENYIFESTRILDIILRLKITRIEMIMRYNIEKKIKELLEQF